MNIEQIEYGEYKDISLDILQFKAIHERWD